MNKINHVLKLWAADIDNLDRDRVIMLLGFISSFTAEQKLECKQHINLLETRRNLLDQQKSMHKYSKIRTKQPITNVSNARMIKDKSNISNTVSQRSQLSTKNEGIKLKDRKLVQTNRCKAKTKQMQKNKQFSIPKVFQFIQQGFKQLIQPFSKLDTHTKKIKSQCGLMRQQQLNDTQQQQQLLEEYANVQLKNQSINDYLNCKQKTN